MKIGFTVAFARESHTESERTKSRSFCILHVPIIGKYGYLRSSGSRIWSKARNISFQVWFYNFTDCREDMFAINLCNSVMFVSFRTTILPQPEKLKEMLDRFESFHLKFLEEYK